MKNCIIKKFFLIIFFAVGNTCLWAQTNVASFFSDGMVLQQKKNINIWGKDIAGIKVNIVSSWGESSSAITQNNGEWKVQLATPIAGGPYEISISGSSEVLIKNVMIGEVWICSGQSNMQVPLKGGLDGNFVNGGLNAIVNSNNDKIRFFTVQQNASFKPLQDVSGKWENASPSTTGSFSAVAYFFAKQIEHLLDVPIGIIVTAWGSSTAEAWTDKKTLNDLGIEASNKKFEQIQKTPGVLFNAMLNPFVGYGIKGFLWYQGEANRHNYNMYEEIVNKMVTSWRNKWNEDDLPFYFAQIAPFNYGKMNSAFLREAQLKISNSLKNAEIVVTIDVGNCSEIHPSKKIEVGKRLAYIALAKDYGFVGFDYSSPKLKDWIVRDNEIVLEFSSRVFIKNKTQPSKNFEIAGPDKIFYPAEATLSNVYGEVQQIIVSSDKVSSPIALRYGFKNCVTPNLFGRNGLPVSSFRTDNF